MSITNAIEIKATENNPEVIFNPSEGVYRILGESRPEDARSFFMPLIEWVKLYGESLPANNNHKQITLTIQLDYFSSSSAKYLVSLLTAFERLKQKGIDFKIIWFYAKPDIQMKEAGEEFERLIAVPFIYEIIE